MKLTIPSDNVLKTIIEGDIPAVKGKTMRDWLIGFWYKHDKVGATSYLLSLLQQLADSGTFSVLESEVSQNVASHTKYKGNLSTEELVRTVRAILQDVFVHGKSPAMDSDLDIGVVYRYLELLGEVQLGRSISNRMRELATFTKNGDTLSAPLDILANYLLPEVSQLKSQFQQLKNKHPNYIKIPLGNPNSAIWLSKSSSMINFIDDSIDELNDIMANILAYTRRPAMLISILERIKRELAHIRDEQDALHEQIGVIIRKGKTKSNQADSNASNQESQINLEQSRMKYQGMLEVFSLRLDNIAKKMNDKSSISRFMKNKESLLAELEVISEKVKRIQFENVGLDSDISEIVSKINSIRGIQSLKTLQETSEKIDSEIVPTRLSNESILSEFDQANITYLEGLISSLRAVSSSRGNSHQQKNSKGDGSIRQDVVNPLLQGLLTCIKGGKIDPDSFSWNQVVTQFDADINNVSWGKSKYLFIDQTTFGSIAQNLLLLVEDLLPRVGEITSTKLIVLRESFSSYINNNPPPSR